MPSTPDPFDLNEYDEQDMHPNDERHHMNTIAACYRARDIRRRAAQKGI